MKNNNAYIITNGHQFIQVSLQGAARKMNNISFAEIFNTRKEADIFYGSREMHCVLKDDKRFKITKVPEQFYISSTNQIVNNEELRLLEEDLKRNIKGFKELYENDLVQPDNSNAYFYAGATYIEESDTNLGEFLVQAIKIMSEIDVYVENMAHLERDTTLKIDDMRHFVRDSSCKLSAVTMAKWGYKIQALERQREYYKRNRIMARVILNNPDALKNKDYIKIIETIATSKYKYRRFEHDEIVDDIKRKVG